MTANGQKQTQHKCFMEIFCTTEQVVAPQKQLLR